MGQHVYTQALPIYKYSIKLGMLKKLKEGKREAFIVDRVLEVFFIFVIYVSANQLISFTRTSLEKMLFKSFPFFKSCFTTLYAAQ